MKTIFNKPQCEKVYKLLKEAQLANWDNGETFTTQAQLKINHAIVTALNELESYDNQK